jgi:myxalamid-type polyketide synthase MxaE and MxaD
MSTLSPTKQALQALQQLQARLDAVEAARREPIAIVGIGCRYPGAENANAFWDLLCAGRDAVSDAPRDRWNADAVYSADASKPGTIVTRRGGFLDALDRFDAAFFGISPREAPHVDPRQRLMLEIAWEALEDAGIPPDSLAGSRAGVFVATLTNDYDHLLFTDLTRADAFSGAGTANSVVANRLSYFLDLHGPSVALDTACSGSLVALHLACESLRSGESTLALAGGVSVNLMVKSNVFFSRAGALSPNGRCRTFDAGADGMVRSDGAGLVVLKTLSQAEHDGDRVLAVIAGSAVNHDGRSNGIMAPNGEAQKAVLAEAYRRAGIAPGAVQYIEAHGTGTRLGDPIEVQALGGVLATERSAGLRCVVGSLKTNIGHTEAAAGVGGVIKTALALRHRRLPPTIHFEQPNPLLGLDRLPFDVRTEVGPWPDPSRPLVAGVSGFGFGGTNAHVVLREAPSQAEHDAPTAPVKGPFILPLSARTPAALAALAVRVREVLASDRAEPADVCRTAAVHRTHHAERMALVGSDGSNLIDALDRRAGALHDATRSTASASGTSPRIAFVFSGQGSHWGGMAADLRRREPVFARVFAECDRLVAERTGRSIVEAIARGGDDLDRTELAQPAIFAVQVALAALWRSWGVTPALVVGHSLGEAAAACVSGAVSLEDAVLVVCERSRLMARLAGAGATAVIGLPLDEARRALRGFDADVAVAGSNAPATTVVSGTAEAIDVLVARMTADGLFARRVAGVDIAFHSPQMDPLRPELETALRMVVPREAAIPIFSTVTAEEMDGRAFGAEYWGRNLREPFLFAQAARCVVEAGCTVLLEVSPHAVLGSALLQTIRAMGAEQVRVLASMRRDASGLEAMQTSLAALYEAGAPVNWREVFRHRGGRRTTLPSYPWQRQRYWYDQLGTGRSPRDAVDESESLEHPLLGRRVDVASAEKGARRLLWEIDISASRPSFLADHHVDGAIVWPAAAVLEMAHAAARQIWPDADVDVADAVFERPLSVADAESQSPVSDVGADRRAGLPSFHVGAGRRAGPSVQLQISTEITGAEASFALYARAAGDRHAVWRRYATATIRRTMDTSNPATVRIDALASQFRETVTADDHYRAMAEHGLDYGARFRGIIDLRRGDNGAVAHIRTVADPDQRYAVHPAVLDAAFQSVAAAVGNAAGDVRYLPYGVRHWRVYAPITGDVWCHARLRGRPGEPKLESDLTLIDREGRVCAEIDGFELRGAPSTRRSPAGTADRPLSHVTPAAPTDPADWLIDEQWIPAPLPQSVSASRTGHWLILCDRSGIGDRVALELTNGGAHAWLVSHGASYEQPDATHFQVRPGARDDYARVLAEIGKPLTGAIHLWALDTADDDPDAIDAGVSLITTSTLHLVQTLAAGTTAGDAEPRGSNYAGLWFVTRAAVPGTAASSPSALAQAPLAGLSLVIAQEHPELSCRLVDLPIAEPTVNAATLVAELRSTDDEPRVAWRDGVRRVARLAHIADSGAVEGGATIRRDRTYLLTGGLGALGLEMARALVAAGARHLLLISRRGIATADRSAREAVSALTAEGVQVTVAAADVADPLLANVLDSALAKMPPLAGVIHAAGVLDDGPLAKLTPERFAPVLRPKVRGTWNLHRYTVDKAIDFFVCFSSAASLVGSAGQANYAAANAFMDALVHHRRAAGLPALSINWGAWASGMAADDRLTARFAAHGVSTIDPLSGVRLAMRTLGTTRMARFGVMPVNWTTFIEQFGGRVPPLFEQLAGTRATSTSAPSWREDLATTPVGERHDRLRRWVRDEVAAVLGFTSGSEIGPSDRFFDLGMDSLTAVELRNRLQTRAGVPLAATLAFDHGTVNDVTAHLASLIGDMATPPSPSSTATKASLDSELDALTDEELALALARELDEDPA